MREFRLPVPKLPDKLPGEAALDRAMDGLANKLERFPPVRLLDTLAERLPYPAAARLGTPFGEVKLPSLDLPRFRKPEMTPRHKDAVKAAVAKDILDEVVGRIPSVGSYAGIVLEPIADTYAAKIHESMTPQEYETYKQWEKKSPWSVVAVLQTFIRRR